MENPIALLVHLMRRHRTRRQLAGLDARLLADIGLTETMRAGECARWFW